MFEKDRVYVILFRILMLFVLACFVVSELVLPPESDEAFVKDGSVDTGEYLKYEEPVFWVRDDGTREQITAPAQYEVQPDMVMTLESTLPELSGSEYFIMRASQQNMKIYVDGRLRVDYDTKDSRPYGTQTTSRYVFCKLKPEDSGDVIRVELVSGAASYSGIVNEMYVGERYSFWNYMFGKYGWSMVFGFIIIMMGVCTILFSVSMKILLKENINLEYVGWCALLMGCWLAGESRFRQLLVPNNSSLSNMCFIMIMLAPIPVSLYLNSLQAFRYKKIYHGIICLSVIHAGLSMLLQLTGTANFLDTMIFGHSILLLVFIVMLITFVLDARKGKLLDYKWECIGLIITLALVIVEAFSTYFITMMSGMSLTLAVLVLTMVSMVNTINNVEKKRRSLEMDKIQEDKERSDRMFMQLIQMVADTLEAKDMYKNGHSRRVAEYTKRIAQKLGFDEAETDRLYYAVTLHDIGKIGVPDSIQNKPAVLSEEELNVIKGHTVIGSDILKKVNLVAYAAPVARSHHERYDGKGYPDGLTGEEIPYEARIVTLADSLDAMNSRRSYRGPLPGEDIRKEIAGGKGAQFDPELADVVLGMLDAGELELDTGLMEEEAMAAMSDNQMLSFILDTFDSKMNTEGMDLVTGLPTRGLGEKKIADMMKEKAGALAFVDMDNLKKINDIHGHKAGDRALKLLGVILCEGGEESYACRIGGDEFLLYIKNPSESEVIRFVEELARRFEEEKKKDTSIVEATLSIGICRCTPSDDFIKVMEKADKALYYVKQRGKNGYYLYQKTEQSLKETRHTVGLDRLVDAIKNAGKYSGAMNVEFREFARTYEYISHLISRYGYDCHLVMVTLETKTEEMTDIDRLEHSVGCMGMAIRENIRTVDVCARYSSVQYLVILFEAKEENIYAIMDRIFVRFHEMEGNQDMEPAYEVRKI